MKAIYLIDPSKVKASEYVFVSKICYINVRSNVLVCTSRVESYFL